MSTVYIKKSSKNQLTKEAYLVVSKADEVRNDTLQHINQWLAEVLRLGSVRNSRRAMICAICMCCAHSDGAWHLPHRWPQRLRQLRSSTGAKEAGGWCPMHSMQLRRRRKQQPAAILHSNEQDGQLWTAQAQCAGGFDCNAADQLHMGDDSELCHTCTALCAP